MKINKNIDEEKGETGRAAGIVNIENSLSSTLTPNSSSLSKLSSRTLIG
jgi:hypothetical protein